MEGFVCLEKQEKLEQLKIDNIKFKELVLSDTNPFPGYYSETPGDTANKPQYVFAIIKQGVGCYEDTVLRAFYEVRESVNFDFDANYGRVSLHNKIQPCIRFKVNDLSKVSELISLFKKEGIIFQNSEKVTAYESNIKIRKFMTFKDYIDDVYTGDKENHYYIKVPKKLKWDEFVKLIRSIKGTKAFGTFDAAQTSLYTKDEILEFVRVYTKSFQKNDFLKLKDEILKLI